MKKLFIFLLILTVSLALCACGDGAKDAEQTETVSFAAGSVGTDTQELTITLQAGETALLDSLPMLYSADFSGSENIEEIYLWVQEHPKVSVSYTVTMPDGTVEESSVKSLDLSHKSGSEVEEMAELIKYLPKLRSIRLGSERSDLSWSSIRKLHEACPDAEIHYTFKLYGKEADLSNTQINLSHIKITDGGTALRRAMECMAQLSNVDLDTTGLTDEECAAIRDDFPDVKVVWRVWFGDSYSVRTDVERILASSPSKAGMLSHYNTKSLKYCTEVKLLDVGHNEGMEDIDFVAYMPELEVCIIAMTAVTDISPLANCPKLEYLEMQSTQCTDLTPLSGLTNLQHLNIVHIMGLSDISPLFPLKKLERLWLGWTANVPQEQIEQMQKAAPYCDINTIVYDDPTAGNWRYANNGSDALYCMRYAFLREQFDDYADSAYSFYWNDPLY